MYWAAKPQGALPYAKEFLHGHQMLLIQRAFSTCRAALPLPPSLYSSKGTLPLLVLPHKYTCLGFLQPALTQEFLLSITLGVFHAGMLSLQNKVSRPESHLLHVSKGGVFVVY